MTFVTSPPSPSELGLAEFGLLIGRIRIYRLRFGEGAGRSGLALCRIVIIGDRNGKATGFVVSIDLESGGVRLCKLPGRRWGAAAIPGARCRGAAYEPASRSASW